MNHTPLLSGLMVLGELPHIPYKPWQIVASSALNFADELIVVHGNERDAEGRQPVLDYFRQAAERDPRIKVLVLPWPKGADFTQVARMHAYGQVHAQGEWVFRVSDDEVFTDAFAQVRGLLPSVPPHIDLVAAWRFYYLGIHYAHRYRPSRLFLRRLGGYSYGVANPAQGKKATPLTSDEPVDMRRWFDGERVIERPGPTFLELPDAAARLEQGELITGYREIGPQRVHQLDIGFLNTDISFVPDEMIVRKYKHVSGMTRQRAQTFGWQNKAAEALQGEDAVLERFRQKIHKLFLSCKIVRVDAPEALMAYADAHDHIDNVIRRTVEGEFGLPWNRVSRKRGLRQRVRFSSYFMLEKPARLAVRGLRSRLKGGPSPLAEEG